MRSATLLVLAFASAVGVVAACGGSSGTSGTGTKSSDPADEMTDAAPATGAAASSAASSTTPATADAGTTPAPTPTATATATTKPTPAPTTTGTAGGGGVVKWDSVVGSLGFFSQTFDDATWTASSLTTGNINSISCVGDTVGWAAGDGGWIGHTKDSGASWQAETSPTTANLHALKFSSTTHGVVAGDHGTIAFTNDGGTTWTTAFSPVDVADVTLRGVALGYGAAFVVGDRATVLRSADGITWTASTVPGAADFVSVASDDTAGLVIAADVAGSLWESKDRGASFARVFTASTSLASVSVARGASHAFAVGAAGAAFVRDAKGSWTKTDVGTQVDLKAALVANEATHLFAAGAQGTLLDSADFGATWTVHPLGTTVTLLGLDNAW